MIGIPSNKEYLKRLRKEQRGAVSYFSRESKNEKNWNKPKIS